MNAIAQYIVSKQNIEAKMAEEGIISLLYYPWIPWQNLSHLQFDSDFLSLVWNAIKIED